MWLFLNKMRPHLLKDFERQIGTAQPYIYYQLIEENDLNLPLSGLKGVQPPLPFGERTRNCSPGHAGKEGPQLA